MGKQDRVLDEFKRDAVAQVVDRGYPVREVREPLSQRALEDPRQTVLLKQAWDDSGEVYGDPLPGRRFRRNLPRGASCTTICVTSAATSAPTGLGVWHAWQG